MNRIHNFSAGPAVLPESVLEASREALLNLNQSGLGLLECSHRSVLYSGVIDSARDRLRRLLGLDEDQEVLFLQGGAQSQFFMVPMNFLQEGRASYLDTGRWSMLAVAEAERFGSADVLFSSKESGYKRVPRSGEWGRVPQGTRYLHYTSNNTVVGTQFDYIPECEEGFVVCDASSDILSRPWQASKMGVIYAGAQKNLGPSGVTLVVIRRSLLERCETQLPTMLRYGVHVAKESMHNTPNTFGIYLIDQVCGWIEEMGGLEVVGARNKRQAGALYDVIEQSGFYQATADADSRSWMNVTFGTGNAELDTKFWKEAEKQGMSGLKGHRSVGGLRASIYNAQTDAAIDALVAFMNEFERKFG